MSKLRIVKLLDPIQISIPGGIVPKGAYDNATDYAVGEMVSYNGSSYVMYNNAGAGTLPTNTTYWQLVAEGTASSDGDKGDITISGSGTTFTIDNDVVTNAKAANMANSTIKGRATSGTGDPEDLTATQVRTILNVADGATANDTDANLKNRANHTGTQAASTISDFNTAADARITAATGVSVQGYDADLAAIAALSPSNDDIIQRKTGAWTNRTMSQLKTDLSLTKSDVGLGNVDNTSDANKPVSTATQTALDAKQATISGATITTATVATNDRVLIQDTSDSNNLKTVTTQAIADLHDDAVDSVNGATGTVVLDADDIDDASTTHKFVTSSDITKLSNLSGTNSGDQNLFSTIAVSGQSDVVADSTTDTLTLAAGSNITITTNATTDTITIAATGGGSISDGDKGDITVSGSGATWTIDNSAVTNAKIDSVAWSKITSTPTTLSGYGITDDAEAAQDAVGTILVDSAEIDFTYNDTTPSITASIVASSIDESKLDASVNASLDLADTSVQPNSSPTFNAITATSSLTIDSSGTANLRVDRGATTNSALQVFTTAGTDRWSVGLRNDSTNDLHIRDAVNAVSIIKAVAGVTPSVNAGGNWTFTNDVTFPAAVVDIDDINATGTPSAANYLRGDGSWTSVTAAPAGSNTQIQFNDGGALGADADLTYNKTTNQLSVGSLNVSGAVDATGNVTIDSAGSAFFIADRAATTNYGGFQFKTAGTVTSSIGTRNDSTENLYFFLDGAASTRRYALTLKPDSESVFNDDGGDMDFRVEGDTDANTFFVDAGVDRVGIGNNAPSEKLDVTGNVKLNNLVINNALSDDSTSGITASFQAAESLVYGDVCYINSAGKMAKADADAIATSGAVAIARATLSTDDTGSFLLYGIVRDDSAYAFTVGGLIYLSTTAGGITQTAPSGTDDVVQVLGVAINADKWLFMPNLVQTEVK